MDPQPAEEPPDSSLQVSGSSISNKFVAYTGGTDQKKEKEKNMEREHVARLFYFFNS